MDVTSSVIQATAVSTSFRKDCSLKRPLTNSSAKRMRPDSSPPPRTIILRPVLRGSLSINQSDSCQEVNGQPKVTWSGCWGLTDQCYSHALSSSIVKAPFYFERTSKCAEDLSSASSKTQTPGENNYACSIESETAVDGYFTGYFCMQDKSSKKSLSFIKHSEDNLLIRFQKSGTVINQYDIVGSGENKFGQFLLEGSYNLITKEMNCARNYLPKSLIHLSPQTLSQLTKLSKQTPKSKYKKSPSESFSPPAKKSNRIPRLSQHLKQFILPEMSKKRKISSENQKEPSTAFKTCERAISALESFHNNNRESNKLGDAVSKLIEKLEMSSQAVENKKDLELSNILQDVKNLFIKEINISNENVKISPDSKKVLVSELERLQMFFKSDLSEGSKSSSHEGEVFLNKPLIDTARRPVTSVLPVAPSDSELIEVDLDFDLIDEEIETQELGLASVDINVSLENEIRLTRVHTPEMTHQRFRMHINGDGMFDPIRIDPTVKFPKKIEFPSAFKVSDTFSDKVCEKVNSYENLIDSKSVFKSSCQLSDIVSDVLEVEPIMDDESISCWEVGTGFDFSDLFELQKLDVKTLKQLNDNLEFSCPSKGG